MLIKEIMKKDVVSINTNDSVYNACLKYKDKKVGCLIVKDENDFCVGIVTERDIIERTICMKKNPFETKIIDIMSSDLITIHPMEKYEKAIEIMKQYSIKKIPVISEKYLVGIITLSDIAHARPDLTERFIDSWVKPEWED